MSTRIVKVDPLIVLWRFHCLILAVAAFIAPWVNSKVPHQCLSMMQIQGSSGEIC